MSDFDDLPEAAQEHFRALRRENAVKRQRLKRLEAIAQVAIQDRIEKLPDGVRSLVPTDYPPEDLWDWLEANRSIFDQLIK